MSETIQKAIEILSSSVNVSTGLIHPNDMNRAKELFVILRENGEVLLKSEVYGYALNNHWTDEDADELGSLAQQIGEGRSVRITDGPWWAENLYEMLAH